MCADCTLGEAEREGSSDIPSMHNVEMQRRGNRQRNTKAGYREGLRHLLGSRSELIEAMMFEDPRVLHQNINSPRFLQGTLAQLRLSPPTRATYTPIHLPIDTSTKCTVCFFDCTSPMDFTCTGCARRVHSNCRGTMGDGEIRILEQPEWTCPLCVQEQNGGLTGPHTRCAVCPPSLQMDAAMRINAKRNAREQNQQVWMHPLCVQAATPMEFAENKDCVMCTGSTARSYMRVFCAAQGCGVTLHTSCALREALRGNVSVMVNRLSAEGQEADRFTGITNQPPYTRMEVLCPTHCGTPLEWPIDHDDNPCGRITDERFPHLVECSTRYCDYIATALHSHTCARVGCGAFLCTSCFQLTDTCEECRSRGAQASSEMTPDP